MTQDDLNIKITQFKRYTVAHPKLNKAYAELKEALKSPPESRVVLVYGPAGVGKSCLLKKQYHTLLTSSVEDLKSDKGLIPAVLIEATAPDSGSFNWKDYYIRLLHELQDILIDQKINFGFKGIYIDQEGNVVADQRIVPSVLRRAVENALTHRKLAAVLIDEAQHMGKIKGAQQLKNQLDNIKSISNMTKTVHVISGSYELLGFRNLDGQLARRTVNIHFPRYLLTEDEDIITFKKILHDFQLKIPLPGVPDLINNWTYMYERSIGCVGILKEWLDRCLVYVINQNKDEMTMEDLNTTSLSISQCMKIAQETVSGENRLKIEENQIGSLRNVIGLDEIITKEDKGRGNERKNQGSHLKVGERLPARDPVGGVVLAE